MKHALIALFMVLTTQLALADFVCKQTAVGWQTVNSTGAVLGGAGFAFGTKDQCNSANPDPKARAVCAWNGTNYSIFSALDGTPFDNGSGAYATADVCASTLKNEKNNKLCLWNGSGWQPFNAIKRKYIGKSGYGFRDLSECSETLDKTPAEYNCSWNGTGYALYSSNTGEAIDDIGAAYSTSAFCATAINEEFAGKTCFWNNSNWQPFSLKTKKFLGKSGFGFTDRKECLGVIKNTNEEYSCNWNGTDYSLYSLKNPNSDFSVMTFLTVPYCQDYISRLKQTTVDVLSIPETDLLKEFIPQASAVGYTFNDCQDPNFSFHLIKKDASGNLPETCIPDTLYSWGDYGKVSWFRERYEKPGDWSRALDRDLYLTQDPIATFGYGPVPIRMKLKPGTKIKVSNQNETRLECKALSASEKQDTIIAAQWSNGSGTGLDYKLCSMAPIESWSYGTKQHFDEIVRDFNWVKSHDYKEYELYYKRAGVDYMWDSGLDGHDFSQTTFVKHMRNIRQLIELKLGGVFYQDKTSTQAQHFKTKKPIYYNPN